VDIMPPEPSKPFSRRADPRSGGLDSLGLSTASPTQQLTIKPRFTLAPTSCAAPAADPQGPVDRVPLMVAGVAAVLLASAAALATGRAWLLLALIGLGLGFALFHSRFGFSSSWQQLLQVGNGTGVRAQLVMLAMATTVVSFVCATGSSLSGVPVTTPFPLGLALVLGAFVFGLGMQLGGSCASGTLFAVGTGQSSILASLAGFVTGALLWTRVAPTTQDWVHVPGIRLADHVGWFGSWGLTLLALLAAAGATVVLQRRRVPPPVHEEPSATGVRRIWRGTWPVMVGASLLGILAGLVFWVSGHVWGTTEGFALWGAKLSQLLGLQPQDWAYWRQPANAALLEGSVVEGRQSLTNLTVMAGAAVAAALAGGWRLHRHLPWRTVLGGLLGGLLMGFGARMSGGCNIGSFIGGIATGSVSGWIWVAAALCGTYVGLRIRPIFGLGMLKIDDSIC
jgi:uncharacterized membrane protein YedE/YeeE